MLISDQQVPVQTSDAPKVGQYKRQTFKRRAGTNVGPVQTSDGYIYKEKRRTFVEFEKKPLL